MNKINNILLELYKDKDQLLVLSVLCSISYWLQDLFPGDPDVIQASGALIVIGVGAAISVGVSMYNGAKNRKAAKIAIWTAFISYFLLMLFFLFNSYFII